MVPLLVLLLLWYVFLSVISFAVHFIRINCLCREVFPYLFSQKTASEFQDVDASRSSGEYGQSRYQEAKPVSGNNSSTSETWRTWSMRRAGFTDEDFEGMPVISVFFHI